MPHVKLLKQSKDWKDRAAGWHQWTFKALCTVCGQVKTFTFTGTSAQAQEYADGKPVCRACERKGH